MPYSTILIWKMKRYKSAFDHQTTSEVVNIDEKDLNAAKPADDFGQLEVFTHSCTQSQSTSTNSTHVPKQPKYRNTEERI